MSPVAFFDRDGTLIEDQSYQFDENKFVWHPGALDAICHLKSNGWKIVVVTNQSAVARGFCTESEVMNFHAAMVRSANEVGATIDAFEFCPFLPGAPLASFRSSNHPDRKPNPGMIHRHLPKMKQHRQKSFLVGDRDTDIEAAHNAGIAGYLYRPGQNMMQLIKKIVAVYQ
ncbi:MULTISPECIES: HAD-IIIA family hydrolase [unclassified Ruegeria]|uniref:D-glycero-alpha-D-manno-heptose-1,7-bisphosphate 7-phosphatase n=1 Tax=unclassified Ruegeria TaxID=2625375 RepID=UPI00148828A0|nr:MULTISPECIES: HAD-IIIA family hydrolase [unclassified Ruegeria]NOD85906.1 HAD-IIIA family hydrolase [Ruegeria sp. HKCCD6119]